MQLAQFPTQEALESAYAEAESADYVEEEAGQRETARKTLERIERHTRRGSLLDLGCWVGFLLDEARARGWSPVGVEPSTFACAFARERFGLDVRQGELMSTELEPGAFDAVVLGDVIEHLLDPGRALDHIAALMRPGGVIHLAVPDAGSRLARAMGARWWSVIPTHVQYFTRHSLTTLLARHGWTVLEMTTAPKAFTVRYYLGRLGGYNEALGRAVVAGAQSLGVADRMWAPDFRDRMAVVARPPSS
jgi:SAM-dependent methyltransferase